MYTANKSNQYCHALNTLTIYNGSSQDRGHASLLWEELDV